MAPIPPPPHHPLVMMGKAMAMAMGGSAPPLPPGMPPPLTPGEMPPNFAVPPPGMMGGMPPNFAAPPPPMEKMIPQPVAPNASLAVARAVVTTEGAGSVAATKLALRAAATKASAISYWYYGQIMRDLRGLSLVLAEGLGLILIVAI